MGKNNDKKKLLKYLKTADLPSWYQCLSPHQKLTLNDFSAYLRDDYEQGSSYRTERCLELLGLSPLISKRKISEMVQLSRGNELAFTFFILEGYYKNYDNADYTMNERILMTCIALMDLLPTLRELDRILPPGPVQKTAPPKQKNDEPYEVAPHKKHKTEEFPYFQRQPRAKHVPSNLITHFKDFTVAFPFWKIGEEPNYGSAKSSPWFEEYELMPCRRTVKHIIDDAVDKYFHKEENSKYGQAEKEEDDDNAIVCEYHKFLRKEMQLVKDQLKVAARDRCLEMIDVTLKRKTDRCKRIVAQLEHDVDLHLERYANMQQLGRTTTRTISKEDCVLCKSLVSTPLTKGNNLALIGDCDKFFVTDVLQANKGKRLTGGGLRIENIDLAGTFDRCTGPNEEQPEVPMQPEEPSAKKSSLSMNRIAFSLSCKPPKVDTDITVKKLLKLTKKSYFTPPTVNTPYKFKFKRVFATYTKSMPQDNDKLLKKYFISALEDQGEWEKSESESIDKHSSILDICRPKMTDSLASSGNTSEHSKYSHVDNRAEIIDAVVRAAKLMWLKHVAIKTAEMEKNEPPIQVKTKGPQILEYKIDKFDPDDMELMDRLLADGMRELKKNQRFVLASLPESNKLPSLREWIRRRYGKTYSPTELSRNLRKSNRIFDLVSKMQNHPEKLEMLGLNEKSESFNNYEKFMSLAAKVKEHYYHKLNTNYIQQLNACWQAMGNYLCPGGPPRKTFYAYMPSIPRDITRHHLWNGECRNYLQFRQDILRRKAENGG